MGVFSNLFGGGAGYNNAGPTAVSSAQVTNEGFDLQKPFIQDIFETAQAETYDIADDGTKTLRGYEEFLGPRIADFNTEQTEALSGLAGLGRQGLAGTSLAASPQYFQQAKDAVTQGQRQFTSADAERLMNPFLDEVIGIQQRETQRSFDRDIAPKLDAEAVAAGSFGGSRAGLMQSEAERNLQQRLDDISAKGRLTAFEQAQKAFEQEQGRQFQGAQLSTALGTEAPAQAARELGLLSSSGEVQQAQEQKALDLAEAEFIRQRDFPMRQLQEYQSLVRGFPFNPSTFEVGSKYQAQPTFGQQLLGGLGTAAGLFGAFGGFSPGKKAGGQVVSRQSGGTIQGGLAGLERHQSINNPYTLSAAQDGPLLQRAAKPPLQLSNLIANSISKPLDDQSKVVTTRQRALDDLVANNQRKNEARGDFAQPTAKEEEYKTLLEERSTGLGELKETVTEESETDIEGATRNKWMALADMSLDFMGRGGEPGDNMFTKFSESAKESGFTGKIMKAAKEERDAAKELRKNLSDIGNKEIANMATLAGTTREEQRRLVNAEIAGLDSKEKEAALAITYQDEIRKREQEIRTENDRAAKNLLSQKEIEARQAAAEAAKKDANKLSSGEMSRYNQQVANIFGYKYDEKTKSVSFNGDVLTESDPRLAQYQLTLAGAIKAGGHTLTGLPSGQKDTTIRSLKSTVGNLYLVPDKTVLELVDRLAEPDTDVLTIVSEFVTQAAENKIIVDEDDLRKIVSRFVKQNN
tara:strand:- start:3871 stop:6120 length:2250 start_codon:yes stop_codon:yes gene_type:complete